MKNKLCPVLALGLGLLCGLLRMAVWSAAYDPATQLVTDTGLTLYFNLFVLLCALVLALLFFRTGAQVRAPYGGTGAILGLRLAAALLSLAAGGMMLWSALGTFPLNVISVLLGLLLAVQGGALAYLALSKPEQAGPWTNVLLLPVFVSCYWLVAFYHQYGSCPSAETYLWPMISGLLAAWAWLDYAGFVYQPRSGRRFALLSLIAVLTLPAAVTAPLSLPFRLSLLAQLVWLWAAGLTMETPS